MRDFAKYARLLLAEVAAVHEGEGEPVDLRTMELPARDAIALTAVVERRMVRTYVRDSERGDVHFAALLRLRVDDAPCLR